MIMSLSQIGTLALNSPSKPSYLGEKVLPRLSGDTFVSVSHMVRVV